QNLLDLLLRRRLNFRLLVADAKLWIHLRVRDWRLLHVAHPRSPRKKSTNYRPVDAQAAAVPATERQRQTPFYDLVGGESGQEQNVVFLTPLHELDAQRFRLGIVELVLVAG